MSTSLPQHLELEPRAGDFLELMRDLGHLDDRAVDLLTTQLLSQSRPGRVVSFEDVRRVVAVYLFEHDAEMRPDARELLAAEWPRLFS